MIKKQNNEKLSVQKEKKEPSCSSNTLL